MEVFDIIDGINARKAILGMNNQQIADASNVPKSTVDRVLRKSTENPTMQVILDIASAVGYDFSTQPEQEPPVDNNDSQYIRHIISMYEAQIAEAKRTHNLITAEKNRWITFLSIAVIILVTGIVAILLIDITNPAIGWYRAELAKYADKVSAFKQLLQGVRGWLGIM